MKNKIRSFLTKNIWLKILSVIVGVGIWAVLSNAEDPTVTRNVTVPVTYINGEQLIEDENIVLLSGPDTVQITATVRQSNLSRLRSDLFTCTADLMDHGGGDLKNQRVHISVTQVGGNDVVIDWNYYRSDPNITVTMDEYIEKTFTIGVLTVNELSNGLLMNDNPEMEPSSVTISGPLTRFGNVASVKASLDLEELSTFGAGTFKIDVPLNMYDANDKLIANADGLLKLETETAQVTASLAREGTVQIKAEGVTGTPKDGYRFLSMSVKPNTIAVHGLNNNSSFDGIVIPASAIDISDISEDTLYEVDISKYLPDGVSIAEPSPIVQVAVSVEGRQAMQITIPKENVYVNNKQPQYHYSLEGNVTTLNIHGFKNELEAFNMGSLNPWISVGGLEAGRHSVKVTISQIPGYVYDNADALYITVVVTPVETAPPDTQDTQDTQTEPTQSQPPAPSDSSDEPTEPTQTSEDETEPTDSSENPTDPAQESDSEPTDSVADTESEEP